MRVIEGVNTSTAGFAGPDIRGAAELPDPLRALLRCRVMAVRDESNPDLENLLGSLRGEIVAPPRRKGRRKAVAFVAVALAATVAIMVWRSWAGGPDGRGRREDGAVMGEPEVSDF